MPTPKLGCSCVSTLAAICCRACGTLCFPSVPFYFIPFYSSRQGSTVAHLHPCHSATSLAWSHHCPFRTNVRPPVSLLARYYFYFLRGLPAHDGSRGRQVRSAKTFSSWAVWPLSVLTCTGYSPPKTGPTWPSPLPMPPSAQRTGYWWWWWSGARCCYNSPSLL